MIQFMRPKDKLQMSIEIYNKFIQNHTVTLIPDLQDKEFDPYTATDEEVNRRLDLYYTFVESLSFDVNLFTEFKQRLYRYPELTNTALRYNYSLKEIFLQLISGDNYIEVCNAVVMVQTGLDKKEDPSFSQNLSMRTSAINISSALTSKPVFDEEEEITKILKSMPDVAIDSLLTAEGCDNVYNAAMEVLKITHPDYFAGMQTAYAQFQQMQATEEEHIQALADAIPSFKKFAKDKVKVWKEMTVTPKVARLKLATGRQLSNAEWQAAFRDYDNIREGSRFLAPEENSVIAQRAFVQEVYSKVPHQAYYERLKQEEEIALAAERKERIAKFAPPEPKPVQVEREAYEETERMKEDDDIPPIRKAGCGYTIFLLLCLLGFFVLPSPCNWLLILMAVVSLIIKLVKGHKDLKPMGKDNDYTTNQRHRRRR